MVTKPCARSDRGCTKQAWAATEKILASRQFCSCKCAAQGRLERGVQPRWNVTFEQRSRAGKKGGPITAAKRRREAVLRRASYVRGLVPQSLLDQLDTRDAAMLLALFVKAVELGDRMAVERLSRRRYRSAA